MLIIFIGIFVLALTAFVIIWILLRTSISNKLAPANNALEDISAQIDNLLAKRSYARESRRLLIHDTSREVVKIKHTALWIFFATSAQRQTAAKVARFVADSKKIVELANKHFVESEIAAYSEFFDTVESKPLTPAQRQACVVNEDSNLVLAGAGTGKTSTMIGRAGYLLESKRASADKLLMLAFAKKAAKEMQERQDSRLAHWLMEGTPTIKTFHALGLEIMGSVERRRPDLTPLAEDSYRLAKFINDQINKNCDDPHYKEMIVRYHLSERFPYRSHFDFKSEAEYIDYLYTIELRTLNGEKVKSFEEVIIANFFSTNSVKYEYEANYKIETSGPDFKPYKPDFFLPDYDIYIEHFALGKDGQPPAYFDQQKYLDGIAWKRELHLKNETKLIETFSYLRRDGILESTLKNSLLMAGVELHPKSIDELLEELRQTSAFNDFATLLSDFLNLFKQSNHNLVALRKNAEVHIDASRLLLLLDLFAPILEAYETELAAAEQIDFADMIRRATEHVEAGRYTAPYTHILVDEFQDISRARAGLIQALIKQRPESVLFAVGDDWQSIYRFTGSDIGYTSYFERYFGATAITPLDRTFRFNDQIGNAASKFVLKNPAQAVKSIQSIVKLPHPAISLIRVLTATDGLRLALEAIETLVSADHGAKATVLVLGRYNFVINTWRTPVAKQRIKSQHPSLKVDFMTIHSAKGKEADYVVVLELGIGEFGFPSEKPTDAFLEFLLPDHEPFLFAEERRIFYVAITRARHRVYLAYNPMTVSSFVHELLNGEDGYQICRGEVKDVLICEEIPHMHCPKCAKGALVPRKGAYGAFVSCNRFPFCDYRERLCPKCGVALMKRKGDLRKCTKCGAVAPMCPLCKSEMVMRNGPYGNFWGCINYRRDSEFTCPGKSPVR